MTVENTARLAVLIDGDNVPSEVRSKKIFDEIAKVGDWRVSSVSMATGASH